MNKSSLEKLLKTDAHYSTDLVSLDFKSQSLNRFLENVVQIVNQHSNKINALEMNKITLEEVRQNYINLVKSAKLPPNILQELPQLNIPERHDTIKETIQALAGNLTQHVYSFQYLLDQVHKQNNKINSLGDSLAGFQTIDNTRQFFRKANSNSKKYTDDEISKLTQRVKDLQMQTTKKLNTFQNLTKEVQKKTLWKITQCQEGLLKKITPEYVDKALQQFQPHILYKVQEGKSQQLNELKFQSANLSTKLDKLSKQYEESDRQIRSVLKQLQQNTHQFEKKEKLDKMFLQVEGKFKQLLLKIDKLEKRQHPQDLELRIMKITSEHGEKLNVHQNKLKKLDIQLGSINSVMESMGGGSGGAGDPHKLCQMDGEIRRLRDANRTNETKLTSLEDQLRTKLLVFEQRVMTTLSMVKSQDHFVSRQQLYESITRLRQPLNQRQNENQNLINQLNGKITKLQMFEKSTKRKIKQMTKGDQLNKILDLKMNITQAQAYFSQLTMKLENMEAIMNKVKMDMESNSDFLRMLQQNINQPEEGVSILGPKAKVFPVKCLGCGYKHVPAYQNNMMQGSDGKLYKVDLNHYSSDVKEVYGVAQNQILTMQSPMKKTAKTRPTSSKMYARPSSSKHF